LSLGAIEILRDCVELQVIDAKVRKCTVRLRFALATART
jgi:hypothetical protein